ncbi:MAG: hypothetical protein V2I33_06040 [Kangiellaceae bacterium]|nr:hypothetical protein [Kangiellaceae bacterium]
MSSIDINQLQQQIDNWIESTGVGYHSKLTSCAILAEETVG